MSSLAVKLYKDREGRQQEENPIALFEAIFGPLPANAISWEAVDQMQETLFEMGDTGPYGLLQRYVLEEHYLYGKTLDSIAEDFAKHIGTFVNELNTAGIRWLQHPGRVKELFKEPEE